MTLTEASEESGIPLITLKVACQRYVRTGGAKGLRATKKRGAKNWFVTRAALKQFKDHEWNSRQPIA